jgi:hypothetical protein
VIATVAKQQEQEKIASDKVHQQPSTQQELQTSLKDKIEQKHIETGRDKNVQVQEVETVVPMQTEQTEEQEETVNTGWDTMEAQNVQPEPAPKKYVEGRGGQNKIEYQMVVEGSEHRDAADMLKVIHEILHRMRMYDSSLVVFAANKDVLDIEKLKGQGDDCLDWAFDYEKELNQHSGKYKYTVKINFMARQSLKNLKE